MSSSSSLSGAAASLLGGSNINNSSSSVKSARRGGARSAFSAPSESVGSCGAPPPLPPRLLLPETESAPRRSPPLKAARGAANLTSSPSHCSSSSSLSLLSSSSSTTSTAISANARQPRHDQRNDGSTGSPISASSTAASSSSTSSFLSSASRWLMSSGSSAVSTLAGGASSSSSKATSVRLTRPGVAEKATVQPVQSSAAAASAVAHVDLYESESVKTALMTLPTTTTTTTSTTTKTTTTLSANCSRRQQSMSAHSGTAVSGASGDGGGGGVGIGVCSTTGVAGSGGYSFRRCTRDVTAAAKTTASAEHNNAFGGSTRWRLERDDHNNNNNNNNNISNNSSSNNNNDAMTAAQREHMYQELVKRLCATLCSDSESTQRQYQNAQKILKTRKSTGFDLTSSPEGHYIERIREHLCRSKGSEAADRFLKLSGQLTLQCNSHKDYISQPKALYSFLLTLSTGVDDTNRNLVLPTPAQSEKINHLFRRQKAGRPQTRPLSTPGALPELADDGQTDKTTIRCLLNLLVGRGSDQINLKIGDDGSLKAEPRQTVHTELGYRIGVAEELANHLVRLIQFQQHAAKRRSLVVQRLAEALDSQLMRHKQLIALLEQMNSEGKLTLARLEYLCLQTDNLLYILADICSPFVQRISVLSGNQVLDALYQQAACLPKESVHFEMANNLLRHCLQPWLAMLRAWMLRGELANTKWDLFVHDVGREGVSNLWYDKFTIQKDEVPAFLNEEDTRKILSVGKAMVFLKEADDVHQVAEMRRQLTEIMGVAKASTPEENVNNVRFEAKTESPTPDSRGFLRAAYELAMQRMKTVILDQFHLKTHLILIRDVVLLYDGVFSKALLSNLSDEIGDTSGSSLSEVERSEVVRVVNRFLPELHEIEASTFIGVHFNTGANEAASTLESFGLKYKLLEPLSFVLQNNSFVFYNRIFAHLFRVRKFSFLFTELSAELQTTRVRDPDASVLLAQVRFFMHEIMNFVLNLESYQFSHVITSAWAELERRVDAMTSVDDLSDAHNAFVENLLKELFLECKAGVHLRSLFFAMNEIHSLIRSLVDGVRAPSSTTAQFASTGSVVSPANGTPLHLAQLFAKCEVEMKRYRSTMIEFLRILNQYEDDKMVQFLLMNFDFNLFYSEQHDLLMMSTTQGVRKQIKSNKSIIVNSMGMSMMNTSSI